MMSSILETRSLSLEILDGSDYLRSEYEKTLRDIETINRLTLGYNPTLKALDYLIQKKKHYRILDVGFGYGDTLRAISKWARQNQISVELIGIDLNPWAKELAEQATDPAEPIRYVTGDAFQFEPNNEPNNEIDIIINSLFMHHLNDAEIVRMLQWMTEKAKLGWFINDLHRHPVAYYFIKYVSRLMGFSAMVQNDAPLSVARSFRRADWERYLTEAQVYRKGRIEMKWHWMFRYGVCFSKRKSGDL